MRAYYQGYMSKEAGGDPMDIAIGLSPVALSLGLGMLAQWNMKRGMEKLPKIDKRSIPALLKASNLPKDYAALEFDGFDNAAFIDSPKDMNTLDGATSMTGGGFTGDRRTWDKALKKVDEYGGGLVYGKEFSNKPVLLHEMGHANVHKGGLSRFNQKYLRPIGAIATGGALLAAGMGNFLDPKTRIALALASPLGMIPTLISEHQATNRGLKASEKVKMTDEERALGKSALSRALATYYVGSLAPGLGTAGALAALMLKYG